MSPTRVQPTSTRSRPDGSWRELARAGTPSLLVLGLLSRTALAMLPVGVLLLVEERTGSLPDAGVVAAALCAGQALGGPLLARLADRRGHSTPGLVAALLQMLFLAFLVVSTASGAPLAGLVALAALLGLSTPGVGALLRTRWLELGASQPMRDRVLATARSYEDRADALTAVAGAALAALVGSASPSGALFLGLLGLLVGQVGLALHGSAVRGHPRRAATHRPDRRTLGAACVVALAAGAVLATVPVLLLGRGAPGQPAPVLPSAGAGVGAVVAVSVVAGLRGRLRHRAVVVGAGIGMTLALVVVVAVVVTPAPTATPFLAVLAGVVGAAVLLALSGAAGAVRPAVRRPERDPGPALLTSAGLLGSGLGLALAAVALAHGSGPVLAGAAGCGLVVAAGGASLRRSGADPA